MTATAAKSIDATHEQDVSHICKAASDPLRTAIIRALAKDSFGVQELAKIFSMPQPGMSHHLKILSTSGLLTSHRQGNSIFYRRTLVGGERHIDTLVDALFRAVDDIPVPDETRARIEQIHEERSGLSRLFFEKNSARFQEKQGQLYEWDEYATNLLDIVNLIPDTSVKSVLEVGPGHGQLLKNLAKTFKRVVAIDNSEKMLDLARKHLGSKTNVEFLSQPLESIGSADADNTGGRINFDVVVLNMVLHHMPSPANTFSRLNQLVANHGFVIVADLNAHDQDWARESCGDLWLGFSPQEIENWATTAGFTEMSSQYLGLKNGFQIQIKLFQHR